MTCFRMIPKKRIGNFAGNTPCPRPVGFFGALFPVFPITSLYLIYVEKRKKRIRGNAYTRVKDGTPIGNSNRKQRWNP